MNKTRLEAFSDGVLAIIITIMVLEMKVPHGENLAALQPLLPVFLSYVLSFLYIGIYWNNHHHIIFISCSGCHCYRLSPAGWVKTTSHPCRPPCMDWSC